MQIFRYMVYIWESYEREEEKRKKGMQKNERTAQTDPQYLPAEHPSDTECPQYNPEETGRREWVRQK